MRSALSPTGRVIIVGSLVMTSGQRYSFHSNTMLTSATVAMVGADTGTTMLQSRRQCPAPSISAASVSDFGIASSCWRSRNVPNPVPSPGRMMPQYVFTPPSPLIRMKFGSTETCGGTISVARMPAKIRFLNGKRTYTSAYAVMIASTTLMLAPTAVTITELSRKRPNGARRAAST